MDLSLLATLKDKLVHASNFSEVWQYFFDHFGGDPEFLAVGEKHVQDPFIEAVLLETGRQMFGKPVTVVDLLLVRLPEYQFLHGGCLLNGELANVLYFEDLRTGLLAVVLALSRETKLARFRGQPLAPQWKPSDN